VTPQVPQDIKKALDAGALHVASKVKDAPQMNLLLSHLQGLDTKEQKRIVNLTNPKGETALMWAAMHGDAKSADALSNAGADLGVQSKGAKQTAFHWAASSGNLHMYALLQAQLQKQFPNDPKACAKILDLPDRWKVTARQIQASALSDRQDSVGAVNGVVRASDPEVSTASSSSGKRLCPEDVRLDLSQKSNSSGDSEGSGKRALLKRKP